MSALVASVPFCKPPQIGLSYKHITRATAIESLASQNIRIFVTQNHENIKLL